LILAEALAVVAGLLAVTSGWLLVRLVRTRREAAVFRAVAEEANDGLLLQAMDTRIVWVNRAYCRMMGRDADEMIGRFPDEYALPPEELPRNVEASRRRYDPASEIFGTLTQFTNVRKNGERFVNQFSHGLVRQDRGGGQPLVVMSCRDVTEQVAREEALEAAHERLSQMAATDWLTGIANRHSIHKVVLQLFERGEPFALLTLNLTQFKQVNVSHGQAAGDAVLRNTARVLADLSGGFWTPGRMAGDEFMIVVPGVTTFRAAARCALTILQGVRKPFPSQSGILSCEGSIGVALSRRGAATVEALMAEAEIALNAARQKRRCHVACYDDRMARQHAADQALRDELAAAVRAGQLEFHFQPSYGLVADRVGGYETLARWRHPTLGPISPAIFTTLLDEMGMMAELDHLAARAALSMQKRLEAAGHPDQHVGFNLSPGSLMSDDFTDFLIWEADRLDVKPETIIVEVLETTFFGDDATGKSPDIQIRRLRAAGFRTFLDDFGVGHAGLAHLAQLQVEGLKIDRALISRISTDTSARVIVTAIFELCRQLDLRVVAEGAETLEELDLLRSMGCEVVQGYVISRPLPPDDALRLAGQRLDLAARLRKAG
jgi:diguanylate cyclase (GGDEF)-like protein/PAS domain S-box-containing protein